MYKLVAGFLLFYLLNLLGGAIMEGQGGIHSSRLTADLTATGTTINVANTSGFLNSDSVQIGNEEIRYVSKTATTLTVAAGGRGYNDTDAASHARGSIAYNSNAGVFNSILGFNIATTDSEAGGISMAIAGWNFLTKSVPKLITWNFSQFMISEWLQMLRWVLVCFSGGFTIYLIYTILSSMGGVAQQVLTPR